MKKEFTTQWISSKQPRKQRKYRANAPLHIRHKLMSATLTKELRKKYGKRNFPIRKGDSVIIMNGEFKKKTGKVENVDLKYLRTTVGGIYRTKKDGTKVNVYFNPSNLQIKELNLDDKRRSEALQRKTVAPTSNKKTEEKNTVKTDKKQGEQNAHKKK
ncbi:50S ribosomal protein L24 [uncultured archaeon]|nr:50S ribosomal protein L24 [uncultured archaeon]